MIDRTTVLVIGGGYAGTMAASRLTQRDDIEVKLINPRAQFVDRIRLHQRVAGTDPAVIDYGDVLNHRVELIVDTATKINNSLRTVSLGSGEVLDYDYLIYAVGSGSAVTSVPGAAEFGYPIATFEEAERLHAALAGTPDSAEVVVAGAGPAGIETAAELAEQGRRVTLVCGGDLGPSLHPRGRRSVARQLHRLGVTVIDGPNSAVRRVSRDAVELANGDQLRSAVTIWTVGFSVPDLAKRSGLATDETGRLLTDETLTSVDDPRIIATGDAAAPSDRPYRMSCQAAVQLGPQAADTVLSTISGRPATPVRVGFAGLCISLGRQAGIFQFTHADDTAKPSYVGAAPGALIKELICRSIVGMQVGHEARRPGGRLLRGRDPRRSEKLDRRQSDLSGAGAAR